MTILREANADAKIIRKVKSGSFHPAPKVESAVIKIIPFNKSRMEELFWPAVESGFRHKRQTLANALQTDLKIAKEQTRQALTGLGLNELARAEELSFEDWKNLSDVLKKEF